MEAKDLREGFGLEMVSRVQLRAVFAGLVVTMGCLAILLGLSWAIGLSAFRPTTEQARGLALGNSIWGAIALWIAVFFGGYAAAVVGRSTERRNGLLHGLVVWGAVATTLGAIIALFYAGLFESILRLAGPAAFVSSVPGAAQPVVPNTREAVSVLASMAGVTLWLYWAGIVGGLFAALFGGFLGFLAERRAPVEAPRERRAPIIPTVPEPT
jgi:hypothetical protein